MLMNVLGVVLCVLLVGFIVWQSYGLIRDFIKRKKLKDSTNISKSNKEEK